jgi:2-(1,2-epoxy-1,2-dihydrophenyl)acetyl-CoA isomerase
MTEASIRLDIADGIACITLDRPAARNSIDLPLARGLLAAVNAVAQDESVRAVIVSSSSAHFTVGGDVRRFGALLDQSPAICQAELDALVATANAATLGLTRLACPVVGLVQGAVAGFGCALAMACDLVIAADDTRFTLAYSAIGAAPDGGASWHLPPIVGLQRALSIALLNTPVDARAALAMGLVSEVVAVGELADAGELLARRRPRPNPSADQVDAARRLRDRPRKRPRDRENELPGNGRHCRFCRGRACLSGPPGGQFRQPPGRMNTTTRPQRTCVSHLHFNGTPISNA